MNRVVLPLALTVVPLAVLGCDPSPTTVVLDNQYPAYTAVPLVVYRAHWQAVSFEDPVAPGASSAPQGALPASDNTAYVLLAPGWDPASATPPTALLVLQSRAGYDVGLGDTLHIPVDDTTFTGNCAKGDPLTQAQADFITQVFAGDAAGFTYDAASCTATVAGDAGSL